jgi:hypothetical protein
MLEGDRSGLFDASPKKPTTMSSFAVVVTEGATANQLLGVNAPLCESTGTDFSIPLKSRIAPAAAAAADQDQL